VLVLYKPLVSALRKTGLISTKSAGGSAKVGIYLLGAGLLISCILLLLAFQGKL
jgi:hypothetical protein